MRALYWFREDLRLEDNPALTACARTRTRRFLLLCCPNRRLGAGAERMGEHRSRFMVERFGIGPGAPGTRQPTRGASRRSNLAVMEAARQWGCQAVYSQRCHRREVLAAAKVADALPHYTFEGATLVHPDDLPFDVEDLPEIFTRQKGGKRRTVVQDLNPYLKSHRHRAICPMSRWISISRNGWAACPRPRCTLMAAQKLA